MHSDRRLAHGLRFSCACILASMLSAGPASAFRGEDEAGAPSKSRSVPAVRAPVAAQLAAGAQALADGLSVAWHPDRGVPISVRGSFPAVAGMGVRPQADAAPIAMTVLNSVAGVFGIHDAVAEFTPARTDTDALGWRHVRMAQRYRGLNVFGGGLVVHFDGAGAPYEVNGTYVPDIGVPVAPTITAAAALALAQADMVKAGRPAGTSAALPALCVFARRAAPRLAYALTLTTGEPSGPGRWMYWVDAQNGTVLLRYNNIQKAVAPTSNGYPVTLTGALLSGETGVTTNVPGWYENTGTFYLYDKTQRWYVYNVATSGWTDNSTYGTRAVSAWGTGDRAEVSAGRNFEAICRYFRDVHARNSFDGAGAYARANVHEGTAYVNAFWDGADFHFGDGDGASASCLAVLDVSGHEFTHAVTEYSAGLVYEGESGALNESFSDIMGTCVEFRYQADGRSSYPAKVAGRADWLCGEDCWLESTALRDLRNPHNAATVGSGNEQPSRYLGRYWYFGSADYGGVHQNSGVQNFVFYLLCEGGAGNNDGVLYNVAGIGVQNAERVAYRALTVYCTADTDHATARAAWMSAARDLNAAWVAPVDAAWSAVGLGTFVIEPHGGTVIRGPAGGPFAPTGGSFALTNGSATALLWTASRSATWADVSPAGGTLPPHGAAKVMVTLNSQAAALGSGRYTNTVSFTRVADGSGETRPVVLLVGQPDFYTELFDDSPVDLSFQQFTFTPDGSADYYRLTRDTASAYPVPVTGASRVTLTDDQSVALGLTGGQRVTLYGTSYGTFYLSSNGYVTFGSGDTRYTPDVDDHFSLPRIAGLFDDLNPAQGGAVYWTQAVDRVAVTYDGVTEYGAGNINRFQIEMFFDGRIRLTCLRLDAEQALAGLSRGTGTPAGFVESDLSTYGASQPRLSVTLPASAREGDGTLPASGRVTCPAAPVADITVSLTSGDLTELGVPATTLLRAGQTVSTFDLFVADDAVIDGPQSVSVTASAAGYVAGAGSMTITDDDIAVLSVSLPGGAREGDGTLVASGTVRASAVVGWNVPVTLLSSDTTEAQVAGSVTIPAGTNAASFNVVIVDDAEIDGSQLLSVTAQVPGWTSGSASMGVGDNEGTNLSVALPAFAMEGQGLLVGAGRVTIAGTWPSDLRVGLSSDDPSELAVPAEATIAAGATSAVFDLTVVNDSERDGVQTARVSAVAASFVAGTGAMPVRDNECGISGIKWNDLNTNGVRDAGEPGLPGWTLFVDANGNGLLDAGERFTRSDASGQYALAADPGTIAVGESMQPGWHQTFPGFAADDTALLFRGSVKDGSGGVDGLDGIRSVAVSPDGLHVYAAGWNDGGVAAFERNRETGELTFLQARKDGASGVDGLLGASGVAVSADGKRVFAIGNRENAMAVFSRNPASGLLAFLQVLRDGVGTVDGLGGATAPALSPDGQFIYVPGKTDNAVGVFRYTEGSSSLAFVQVVTDGLNGFDGLGGASAVAVSPDGVSVYVAGYSDNALAVLSRDAADGRLSFVQAWADGVGGVDGLSGAGAVTVSPDGGSVYVASYVDDAIAAFSRNRVSGKLDFVGVCKDGVDGVDGLSGAYGVTVSPDGGLVYAVGFDENTLAVFQRSAATSALTPVQVLRSGTNGVTNLMQPFGVAVSPDGMHVYAAANRDDAVVVCRRVSPVPGSHWVTLGAGETRDAVTFGNAAGEPDSDGDGLPDWFEWMFFRGPTLGLIDEDSDGDGASNGDEARAGTNPNDPESMLRVTDVETLPAPGAVIQWASAAGRTYGLLFSTNLVEGFAPLRSNIVATPPVNVATAGVSTAEARFYRVVVESPTGP